MNKKAKWLEFPSFESLITVVVLVSISSFSALGFFVLNYDPFNYDLESIYANVFFSGILGAAVSMLGILLLIKAGVITE